MSAEQHDREAASHEQVGEAHAAQGEAQATTAARSTCAPPLASEPAGVCWSSVANPTAEHRQAAEAHRTEAARHRAASAALRAAEARACVGIAENDRDMSPFEHLEDMASVEPLVEPVSGPKGSVHTRTAGAEVTFRAVPGLTVEWLQRLVDCHLARNAARGHVVPEMPNCPLVPKGAAATVRSTGNGFAVSISSADDATAREILARAERLRGTHDPEPAK